MQSRYSPPTSPSVGFYARSNWSDVVNYTHPTFGNMVVSRAYIAGLNAYVNTPTTIDYGGINRVTNSVILSFGRQEYVIGGFDIGLPETGVSVSYDWVRSRAYEFMLGYKRGHEGTPVQIAVTTSNYKFCSTTSCPAETNWRCPAYNDTNQTLSANWSSGGASWGNFINTIPIPSGINLWSGSDIEVWNVSGISYKSCGRGMRDWLNSYRAATSIPHLNYGENTYAVGSSHWTSADLYAVSFGTAGAYVAPQIYCPGQVQPWVTFRSSYVLFYSGVISTNGLFQAAQPIVGKTLGPH